MAARSRSVANLVAGLDDPLIGVIVEEDGQEVVHYFTSEDQATVTPHAAGESTARQLAGIWSDLDWDEMMDELERIRHESTPTPPIDDP